MYFSKFVNIFKNKNEETVEIPITLFKKMSLSMVNFDYLKLTIKLSKIDDQKAIEILDFLEIWHELSIDEKLSLWNETNFFDDYYKMFEDKSSC